MNIRNIKIRGFRNLKGVDLTFDQAVPIHAFVGPNGQGKTNILEAIYLCCLSKSFRTRTGTDLVGFEDDFSSVKIDLDETKLEVILTAKPAQKVLKVNGVKRSATEFIGHLKAVFFSPDDLAHMSFSPRLRRRYLDVVLSQLNQDYLIKLMEYGAAIRQRNALLKTIREKQAEVSELDFWDEKLAQLGATIVAKREKLISRLQTLVSLHYKEISKSDSEISIVYESEVRGVNGKELLEMYKKNRRRDLAVCQTHLGPHRDDLQFLLDGKDMAFFASRGEWRSLVLAMKFAEIDLIKEQTGEDPVLLLDDVFSELDAERQKFLFDAIGKSQTFITTTHKEFIEALPTAHTVYNVSAGAISSAPA